MEYCFVLVNCFIDQASKYYVVRVDSFGEPHLRTTSSRTVSRRDLDRPSRLLIQDWLPFHVASYTQCKQVTLRKLAHMNTHTQF